MQNRVSLIAAFSVLAVVSCLLGMVLMPNSSSGEEQVPRTQAVNFQAEEKTETPQESEETPREEAASAKIDTDFDAGETSPVPVETDMHEFMEYVLQPSFKRLKPAMAKEPVDNSGWKTIKAEALTLAEAGNLILMRPPEDNAELWNLNSVKVRGHGKILYQAARAKDFELASLHYRKMLISCNACHIKFADGEHILTP